MKDFDVGIQMNVCHIREFSYPMVKSDGVGALIYKLSNYLFNVENSCSSLITRRALGLPRLEKRSNLTVYRIGLEPPKNLSPLPIINEYPRNLLFAAYSKDLRFLYERDISVDGISAIRKLAEEAVKRLPIEDVDIFHCHGMWTNFEAYIGLFIFQKLKKPFIFHLQGHFGSNTECMNLDHLKPWYNPIVGNNALACSKAIIANRSTLEFIRNRVPSTVKLVSIPTCVDTNYFKPEKINDEKPNENILFLARLTNFKDPITAVKAMKIVIKSKPNAKLNIVGGGPLTEEIQLEVQRQDLEKSVAVLGEIADTRASFLRNSIFLAISPIENYLSNSLLEAMASGLAIIATDVGETRNIIINGENGVLVPPKDPSSLATAILSILSSSRLQQELSRNSIKTAKLYDINELGKNYVSLYKEILSEK